MFSAVRCAACALSLLIFSNIFILSVLRTLFNMALATFIGAKCHTHTHTRALSLAYGIHENDDDRNERTYKVLSKNVWHETYVWFGYGRAGAQIISNVWKTIRWKFQLFLLLYAKWFDNAIYYLCHRNLNMPKTAKSSELLLVCVCCESNRFRATTSPCR